ncbi:thiamine transporter [Halobacillus karajensis]|uniref:Thiamine ECF transporter S component ThiT n=1 Tax=Halobacillus karajensis TaxID=195088 RepID=A0A024P2W0_9BACI|nr:energy-coupled thiamine transporter ThiT [Halobacillus karajensis]CDQ20005.1 Thiamine ECF transporter S component ThiT [Halobacillus karajensis]CDQ22465.1 Thiamine ECF transporter S component ThiT [Halobacillus karajensis]CDQ28308.1 Thiamine ECF transporter S component ThiT [Halobacillus karajensis]SEH68288.1 thiamine transporter [Halobacillus karajensis]
MRNHRVLFTVEIAIFSALALLLDIIPFLSFKLWAQGGSVSFAMVPVFIMAFRWGLKGGLTTGFLLGIYQILTGAYIMTPVQAFLDYVVAFTVIGAAGLVAKPLWEAIKSKESKRLVRWIIVGCLIGSVLRFFGHFFAGIAFYGEFAPEGQPVWLYSLVYNGGYMLPAFLLSSIVVSLLFIKRPTLLTH